MNEKKVSILLVDDTAYNIMILEEFLDADYKLSSAVDGEQAWLLLENNPNDFDIVLLDWIMPKMDGIEVLKRIRAHSELKHIKVIMQTTNGMKDKIQQAMDTGADDFIIKPYNEQDIINSIESAVKKLS